LSRYGYLQRGPAYDLVEGRALYRPSSLHDYAFAYLAERADKADAARTKKPKRPKPPKKVKRRNPLQAPASASATK
jgi:hypothetical protein